MRRTEPDPARAQELRRRHRSVGECQQCGACLAVCPSGRHGGIDCADLMHRASLGTVDPAEEGSVWRCAACMSCSERCPSAAAPAEVIALLREEAARAGNLPEHFREEARRYLETGACFPRTGLTRKMRRELGLEEAEASEEAVREAREIARRTGLGRLALE